MNLQSILSYNSILCCKLVFRPFVISKCNIAVTLYCTLQADNSSTKIKNILIGLVQCFSMQVVMNKCFLLNPEKN